MCRSQALASDTSKDRGLPASANGRMVCEHECQLSLISAWHLCHSLGSTPFQGRLSYYGMIRLLQTRQAFVVAFLGLTLSCRDV